MSALSATKEQQHEYIKKMLPYSIEASRRIGFHVEVLLSQWSRETGWGLSELAGYNNHAGITYKPAFILPTGVGRMGSGSISVVGNRHIFCKFHELENFVSTYCLTWQSPVYLKYLQKVKVPGTSKEDLCRIIGESPWCETRYSRHEGIPGEQLVLGLAVINKLLPFTPFR